MRHIATFSGGVTSAYVCDMVLRDHPEAEIVFTDTRWEDEDLYRFLTDCEQRWKKPVTILSHGQNPEELFNSQGILGNDRMPVCSRILKAKQMQDFLKSSLDAVTVYFGIDASEAHRAEKIVRAYSELPHVKCAFPLVDAGWMLDKDKIISEIETAWGIQIPRLYKMGFDHNNCGGGCVRGKKGHWLKLLRVLPDVYADRERMEREFRKNTDGLKYTILEGKSLKQLRAEAESQPGLFDVKYDGTVCICFEVDEI